MSRLSLSDKQTHIYSDPFTTRTTVHRAVEDCCRCNSPTASAVADHAILRTSVQSALDRVRRASPFEFCDRQNDIEANYGTDPDDFARCCSRHHRHRRRKRVATCCRGLCRPQITQHPSHRGVLPTPCSQVVMMRSPVQHLRPSCRVSFRCSSSRHCFRRNRLTPRRK